MKKLRLALLVLCLLAYAGGCALGTNESSRRGETGQAARTSSALRQTGRIPLPGVEGRIDHMALDSEGGRLFVAALGNGTVEVVDTKSGRRIDEIGGLEEPQGVAYLPDAGRLLVTNGGGDSLKIYDGRSLRPVDEVRLGGDPDNVRYDPSTGLAYVGYGEGDGAAIGVVDVEKGEKVADIALSAHPESFQLEGKGGERVFANVPGSGGVEVADRKKGAVVDSWPIREAGDNFPMALDEADQRLFVGTRSPARLLVLDTATGKTVASLDSPGDADDVFYDAKAKRIYVTGGDGTTGVFEQKDPDAYRLIGEVPTAEGARTSLFVPETGALYLAVPRSGGQEEAEVRAYDTRHGK